MKRMSNRNSALEIFTHYDLCCDLRCCGNIFQEKKRDKKNKKKDKEKKRKHKDREKSEECDSKDRSDSKDERKKDKSKKREKKDKTKVGITSALQFLKKTRFFYDSFWHVVEQTSRSHTLCWWL